MEVGGQLQEFSPPDMGIPAPGAYAGSTTSISIVANVGLRHIHAVASQDLLVLGKFTSSVV